MEFKTKFIWMEDGKYLEKLKRISEEKIILTTYVRGGGMNGGGLTGVREK